MYQLYFTISVLLKSGLIEGWPLALKEDNKGHPSIRSDCRSTEIVKYNQYIVSFRAKGHPSIRPDVRSTEIVKYNWYIVLLQSQRSPLVLKGDNVLVVFYYLSTSEIWPHRGVTFGAEGGQCTGCILLSQYFCNLA
jgi:hypothetical protein